jgi:hypothetical protein
MNRLKVWADLVLAYWLRHIVKVPKSKPRVTRKPRSLLAHRSSVRLADGMTCESPVHRRQTNGA